MSHSKDQSMNEDSSPPTGDSIHHPSQPHPLPNLPSVRGVKEIGVTPLAHQLGLSEDQTNGHWCSRCQGIWYGYTLETECPVCGNRRG